MDRSTFSKWGSIVCVVVVVAIMMAFATPFGKFVTQGVQNSLGNLGDKTHEALSEKQTLEGDGQEYAADAPSTLSFRSPAPLSEFQKFTLNGKTVPSSEYTLTEGSTIVTLKASYLETLPNGNYEVAIVSENMVAKGGFTVTGSDVEGGEDGEEGECTHANVTHTYDWNSVNAYHSVTCLDCGNVANEDCYAYSYSSISEYDCVTMCICGNTIGDQGHNFSAGVCTYCGYGTTSGCAHENLSYQSDYSGCHSVTCTDCGTTIEEVVVCSADRYEYADAESCYAFCDLCGGCVGRYEHVIEAYSKCSNCGYNMCAHEDSYYYADGEHYCNECDSMLPCNIVNGTCSVCGHSSCAHENLYYNPVTDYEHAVACSDCGTTVGTESHEWGDMGCTKCGAT